MAAGRLPRPGTTYGPCVETCEHRDCAATRRDAEKSCTICDEPISYDRGFYRDDEGLVHSICFEESISYT